MHNRISNKIIITFKIASKMITLTKSGNAIVFEFDDNSHYLNDGTIEVPVNSLTLVTDDSQMATFRKSASNDIFISATYDELGMSKAELESWFKENACGSTGGGGGVTSGEVQTMIDESISGKADTSDVQEIASDVSTVSGDVNTLSGSVNALTGAVNTLSGDVSTLSGSVDSNHNAITAVVGDVQTLSGQVQGDEAILTGHTANTDIHVTASDKQNWNNKSDFSGSYNDLTDKPTIPVVPTNVSAFNNDAGYATSGYVDSSVSGKVNTTDFNTYSASTDNRLSEDEEVTSAALNELNEALDDKADATAVTASIAAAVSGKQDTLVSGTNIKTINNESLLGSGNIDIQGGSSINVVQTTGTSTGDVMSQNAVTTELNNKASKSQAVGSYQFGEASGVDKIQLKSVSSTNIGNAIYYPKINNKGILTSSVTYAQNNFNFQLVETSAITSSVTSASTDSEIPSAKAVYDALQEGGGKAIEAGRGIAITTGATADTVSFNLPITSGTGVDSIIQGVLTQNTAGGAQSHAEGQATHADGNRSHAEGFYTIASGQYSHAEGSSTKAGGNFSHAEGNYTVANNSYEHASGQYNNSVSASTTFGNSGNTLFSVGNGTADNARHNAFEIRQNGDIYCSDGTNDVKLQDTITATAANTTALGGLKLVSLTQAQYDALATKDASTLYIITGSN